MVLSVFSLLQMSSSSELSVQKFDKREKRFATANEGNH